MRMSSNDELIPVPYDPVEMDTNEQRNKPAFYAVVPVMVLDDPELTAGAKVFYAKIAALCRREGFCWASNTWFANDRGVSKRIVTNWLALLSRCGYISVEIDKRAGNRRKIWLEFPHRTIEKNCASYRTKVPVHLKEKEVTKRKTTPTPSIDFGDPELQSEWESFQQHRKELRKPITPTARTRLIAKLRLFGVSNAIKALRISIDNGWQGVFDPTKRTRGSARQEPSKSKVDQDIEDYIAERKRRKQEGNLC